MALDLWAVAAPDGDVREPGLAPVAAVSSAPQVLLHMRTHRARSSYLLVSSFTVSALHFDMVGEDWYVRWKKTALNDCAESALLFKTERTLERQIPRLREHVI
jgi:hypothetical protein